MKKFLAVIITVASLLNVACFALPATYVEDEAGAFISDIYEADGYLSYYETNNEYTINAIVLGEVIDFNLGYPGTGVVYSKEIDIEAEGYGTADFWDQETWSEICKIARQDIPTYEEVIAEHPVTAETDPGVMPLDTDAEIFALLEGLYGKQHGLKAIGSGYSSGYTVNVYEDLEFHNEAHFEENIGGKKVQQAASAIGVKSKFLATLLGLMVSDVIPTNTNVLVYEALVYNERIGRISGKDYYADTHTLAHRAVDVIGVPDDLALDETPYLDSYYESEDNFNGIHTFVENTVEAYLR